MLLCLVSVATCVCCTSIVLPSKFSMTTFSFMADLSYYHLWIRDRKVFFMRFSSTLAVQEAMQSFVTCSQCDDVQVSTCINLSLQESFSL